MDLQIRPFRPADFEQVIACQADLYAVNFPRGDVGATFVESQRSWIQGHLNSGEPCGFFIAESEGRLLGFIWGRVLENVLEGREGFVMQNYVRPEWRRQGVARALLERLEVFFRSQAVSKIVLNVTIGNDGALALYQNAGYQAARYEMEKRATTAREREP